jgi:NAD(P)-dependent dehydrogenase (short-subunit alcohol dehydrogenase family)
MRFKGKNVIVTGAGSGIGRAIAYRFAEEGADISIPDIDLGRAQETAGSIEAMGCKALVLRTDVAESQQVQDAIAKTLEVFDHIDILVNNAGINIRKFPNEFTDEEWHHVINVNLHGVWYFCRYVLDHFLERGQGNIVNVASIGAFQAAHDRAPYMASKGAVVSLTRALANDLADRNIRVNAVAPGNTATSMTATQSDLDEMTRFLVPMKRWAQPGEIASVVAFLASDDASFVTGHTLCVDGGMIVSNKIGRSLPK